MFVCFETSRRNLLRYSPVIWGFMQEQEALQQDAIGDEDVQSYWTDLNINFNISL